MHRAVIEVGPAQVRRLCCGTAESGDAGVAALEWVDDPVALLDDSPIPTPRLWRSVLENLACEASYGSMLLIHPSWWPPARIERVTAAAGRDDATVRPRAELLAGDATVVVEIAAALVAVIGGEVIAEPRLGPPAQVADAVAPHVPRGVTVVIDAPTGVPGAAELARLITERLRAAGIRAKPARLTVPQAAARRRNRPAFPRRGALQRAVAAALGLLVAGVLGTHRSPAPAPANTAVLVEGRVTLQVPADWLVRRVTDGPGSARVEVVSPTDPQLMLHLTQARVPEPTLAAVAETLDRAVREANAQADTRAPVFVDFNPAGTAAGRPAITYAERRLGHRIDWTVLVDGAVRIGIGCQRRDDDPASFREACAQAVSSARAVPQSPR